MRLATIDIKRAYFHAASTLPDADPGIAAQGSLDWAWVQAVANFAAGPYGGDCVSLRAGAGSKWRAFMALRSPPNSAPRWCLRVLGVRG